MTICVLHVTFQDGGTHDYLGENMLKALGSLLACERERDIKRIDVLFRERAIDDSIPMNYPGRRRNPP